MKLRLASTRTNAGILMVECAVYVFVFVIIVGLGLAAFFSCWNNWQTLRRNANDISGALNAGELWRADIRAATGAIAVKSVAGENWLRIPQHDDEVIYAFTGKTLKRQARATAPWTVLLSQVTASSMTPDSRAHVKAWRWELELTPGRRGSQMKPLFTFLAVPPAAP